MRRQSKHLGAGLALFGLSALLTGGLVGCERDGVMEEAGEDLDEAVEDAGEAIEDAGDKVKDTLKGDG